MWEWLKGKKTFIGCAIAGVEAVALTAGWIDEATMLKVNAYLVPLIGVTLRLAIADVQKKVEAN